MTNKQINCNDTPGAAGQVGRCALLSHQDLTLDSFNTPLQGSEKICGIISLVVSWPEIGQK